jgi:lactate 2-monooxygenase
MADFADYYREIYARGLGGETPSIPIAVEEQERRAHEAMDERAANYVFAGAGAENTMRANRDAFARRRIVPRMLRDVAERDLSLELLGTAMPAPLLLAPIGVQKVVHGDGELATARAAATVGVPMIASTNSHFTLEEIAEAGGEAPRWFQLYWPNDRKLAASFVGRAEAAGYAAIVLTVDTFVPGWKSRDLQQAWLPFLNGMGIANYFQDPVFRDGLERSPEEDEGAATGHFLGVQANPSLTWDDLGWLRETTSLPLVVKGIQHVDDAREAARRGVDGIVVSNHGGRQVDGAIASLDALEPIAKAVGSNVTVLFDSGADVLKALALGADAVCVGRPYVWGLALGGEAGVETVLKMILAELDLTMALCGYTSPDQLGPDALA